MREIGKIKILPINLHPSFTAIYLNLPQYYG